MENSTIVKYKKYKGRGTGSVNIPKAIAGALKWKPEDEIAIEYEVINGKKGIFLYKLMPKTKET